MAVDIYLHFKSCVHSIPLDPFPVFPFGSKLHQLFFLGPSPLLFRNFLHFADHHSPKQRRALPPLFLPLPLTPCTTDAVSNRRIHPVKRVPGRACSNRPTESKRRIKPGVTRPPRRLPPRFLFAITLYPLHLHSRSRTCRGGQLLIEPFLVPQLLPTPSLRCSLVRRLLIPKDPLPVLLGPYMPRFFPKNSSSTHPLRGRKKFEVISPGTLIMIILMRMSSG